MKDIIRTLQQYQTCALDRKISFDLDITVTPDETKARVSIHSTATGPIDEQRYMKTTISSDDSEEYATNVVSYISNFIEQISTSQNLKVEE